MSSPWERALGADAARLHPALARYFGVIPTGHVGRGSGVFESVGTPRRWLWPVLWVLSIDGIVFPVWERDVSFDIVNRPTAHGTVRSRRTFHFASGAGTMSDEIGTTAHGLTDRLGRHGMLAATLGASVEQEALVVRSTGVTLRLGPVRLPLGRLSPRVTLVESSAGAKQRVVLTLDAPVVGRLYQYEGEFEYRIEVDDD